MLGIFSKMLADIFAYSPCCQKTSIMFPDTSSEVLSHLLNVLYTGVYKTVPKKHENSRKKTTLGWEPVSNTYYTLGL